MAVKVDLPILTAKEKYNSAINIANQRLQQQEEEKARRSAMISLPTPPAPSRAGSLTMPTRLGKTKVQNNAYFASGVAEKEQQRFLDIADTLKGKANAIGSDVSRAGRSRTEADPAIKQQQEQLYAEADKYVQMANEARLQSQAAKDQARLSAYDKLRTQEEFWTVAQAGERAFVQQSKTQAGVDKLAKQANPSDLAAVLGDTGNAYYTSKYEQVNAMTDHEKGIYYYLLAKEGQEAADEFLNLLAESLNARIGIKDAEMLKENGAGGFVAPLAGLESAFTGTAQLISGIAGKPLPTPAMQYTSQAIRQDLNGVGGALYDVAYTAGNMAPSIALSAGLGAAGLAPKVANAIGALALGTSASGNAYKDALNRGYTQEQAMTYGLFTGASEAGLQYLLGGIGKLSSGMFSGKIGSAVTKALEKLINNPQVVATISKYVSSMGSEFTEEYLQEVLDPVFRNIAANEGNDVNLISADALYAGFLGALTAGFFEGAGDISSGVSNSVNTTQPQPTDLGSLGLSFLVNQMGPTETVAPQGEAIAEPVAENTVQAATAGEAMPLSATPNEATAVQSIDLPAVESKPIEYALPVPNQDVKEVRHSAEPIEIVVQRNSETSFKMQHFNQLAIEISTMEYDPATVYTKADYRELVNKPAEDYTANDIMMLVKALSDKKGLYLKDPARVLDTASGGNREVRQALFDIIEKPFNQAGGQYGRRVDNQLTSYDAQMRQLGIKPNSAEDAAVMKFGEGRYMDADGKIIPYTLSDLQAGFPQTWQKIVEADKLNRRMYDSYLKAINTMREAIYPRLMEYAQGEVSKATEVYKNLKTKQKNQQSLIDKMLENIKAKEDLLASKKRTDTQAYADLQTSAETLKSRLAKARGALAHVERKLADAEFKIQSAEKAITDGDILGQKQIIPRQDYYHHVRELSSTFDLAGIFSNKGAGAELAATGIASGKQSVGGLGGLIDQFFINKNGQSEISPELVGTSDYTKPKTKWQGILEQRRGGKYRQSAYAGMVDYISTGEFMLAYDPITSYYRALDSAMMKAATVSNTKNSNTFREWFKDWTDILAGKSDHVLDRGVQKIIGRNVLSGLNRLNSLVKSSTLLYNVRSAVVQVSNIPNAMQYMPNPLDWTKGAYYMANAAKGDADYANILRQSNFMSQRYMTSSDEIVKTTKTKLQQPGLRMLEAGQRFGDLLTWWTAFSRYDNNQGAQDAMFRDYANAIDYADDITRRSVAGRGIGEVPLVLQSKTANLLTPFQIEVNNAYLTMKEQLGKAFSKQSTPAQRKIAAAGIAQYEIGAFLFNAAARALFGDDILGFDFLHVLTDALKDLTDDDKDESVLVNITQNTLGTILEGLPFVSFVIPQLIDAETSEKIFGADKDPSRYGTGTLGTNAIGQGIGLMIDATKGKAELWNVIDLIANFVPFGGKQAARAAQGIATVAQGGSYTKDAEGNPLLQFRTDQGVGDYLQAGLFGKWALPEAREYIESGFLILSAPDTKAYQDAVAAGIDGAEFLNIRQQVKNYTSDKDQSGKTTWSATQKARKYIMQLDLTAEQKALIDSELLRQDFVADYSDETMFKLSNLGKAVYEKAQKYMSKGWSADDVLFAEQYKDAHDYQTVRTGLDEEGAIIESADARFKNGILTDKNLTAEEKVKLYRYFADNSRLQDSIKSGKSADDIVLIETYALKYGALDPIKDSSGKITENTTDQFRKLLMADKELTDKQKAMIDSAVLKEDFFANYSNDEMFELSLKGDEAYTRVQKLMNSGYSQGDALMVERFHDSFTSGTSKARDSLYGTPGLTPAQKAMIDKALTGKSADYTNKYMYELSVMSIENGSKAYTRAQTYIQNGITAEQALKIEQYRVSHKTKDEMVDYLLKTMGLSRKQTNVVIKALGWKPI